MTGPADVRAELNRAHLGEATCGHPGCTWRVACTETASPAELIRHWRQTHDKEPA